MFDKQKIEQQIKKLQKQGKSSKEIASIIKYYQKGLYDDPNGDTYEKAKVYRRYHVLRRIGYSVTDAFFKIRDELIEQGIDPEPLGLGEDKEPQHFARAYNRYKTRQLKK